MKPAAGVELAEIGVPDFGLPSAEPSVPDATYQARLAAAGAAAAGAGLDALLVYADREHFANLSYLTRYDPRFEEALLILVPGRPPVLLVGNEGVAYAAVVPPGVEVVRYQSFSLVNQPRSDGKPLAGLLASAGLGTAGWASPAGSTSARTTSPGRGTGSRCPPTWWASWRRSAASR